MENVNELLPMKGLTANRLSALLEKRPEDFTREDIIRAAQMLGAEMVQFMYPGGDGRLKTLSFTIINEDYLRTILTDGERVDGSSLFRFIDASSSDLYVVPRYSTAFIDPFSPVVTITLLCSFFDRDGRELASSSESTLRRAMAALKESTGLEFRAMGELEYYVIRHVEPTFPAVDQHGYHESAPFAKSGDFRLRCMHLIAQCGGHIKYGHSEVGNFVENGLCYEQNEIEFLPVRADRAAEELLLAKWIIRNLGHREGYDITFAPKITVGKAGSGMHIHMQLVRDGESVMLTADRQLSTEARRAIAGMMLLARGITAFGNKNPTSYFRLVPHQEAPTTVCWGMSNRSVLVRVPLGWTSSVDMCHAVNGLEKERQPDTRSKQTVEMRSPDASADIYQLLAGLCVACRYGLEREDALDVAAATLVDGDIHDAAHAARLAALEALPESCSASAEALLSQREVFEACGVFSAQTIDAIAEELCSYGDGHLRRDIEGNTEALARLVREFFHCG